MRAEALLDEAVRGSGDRIRAALAMRFRDLDMAEEAFAFASLKAVETWGRDGPPRFIEAIARQLACRGDVRQRVGSGGNPLLGSVQLHHDSGKALGQRVVDVASEPGALRHDGAALLLFRHALRGEQALEVT